MTLHASCHCGAVQITVTRPPASVTSCNCSFCSKRGALWAYFLPAEVVVSREDAKSVYAPRVVNQHHFCSRCGCTTYSITPDWSVGTPGDGDTRIAVNARLFDDYDLEAVRVEHLDGRTGW